MKILSRVAQIGASSWVDARMYPLLVPPMMPPMPDIARTGSWTSKYLSHIVHLPRRVCGCEKKKRRREEKGD